MILTNLDKSVTARFCFKLMLLMKLSQMNLRGFTDLNAVWFACRLHSRRCVNCVPKEAIPWHFVSNDSRSACAWKKFLLKSLKVFIRSLSYPYEFRFEPTEVHLVCVECRSDSFLAGCLAPVSLFVRYEVARCDSVVRTQSYTVEIQK